MPVECGRVDRVNAKSKQIKKTFICATKQADHNYLITVQYFDYITLLSLHYVDYNNYYFGFKKGKS